MPSVRIIPRAADSGACSPAPVPVRKRVAGYARVSTDHDEQFTSYEAQIEYYTRYIKSREDWDFVGIYTDEGLTGTNTRFREGFNRMVADALAGRIDLIVTKSVSRFARNTVDSLTTIRKLRAAGCELYFEKENIWTFDSKGELLLTIMSSLAQEESRSISANVTWGIRESMRTGHAYVPYKNFLGYYRGPAGEMLIDPEQAAAVRRIFAMFLGGMSPSMIARRLMDEGVPSPSGRRKWFMGTVASILGNEKYRGDALRQKTYTRDYLTKEKVRNRGEVKQYYISEHHEAIIPPAVFERVQDELAKRGTGTHDPGLRLVCPECGHALRRRKPRKEGDPVFYECAMVRGGACGSGRIPEERILLAFRAALDALFSDPELRKRAVARALGREGVEAEAEAERECVLFELSRLGQDDGARRELALSSLRALEDRRLERLREADELSLFYDSFASAGGQDASDARLRRLIREIRPGKNSAEVLYSCGAEISLSLSDTEASPKYF